MSYGIRVWDAGGTLTFDSSTDLTLFPKTEQVITGSQVGSGAGMTISYPQFTGSEIVAFMTSPYGTSGSVDGYAVLSCRISYPNKVPTVQIFVDNNKDAIDGSSLPINDGYLLVMLSGGTV